MFLKKIGRAGALIVLAAFCFNVMAQKSSFEKPDFAFPETVSASAEKELPKAMADGNWNKALQALVQITVASNSVSTDSLKAAAERIDSVARIMPQPWRSVGLLLEARLLGDAYQADSWTYNQRNLPEGEVPRSIASWSKDTFARRILQLIEEAYAAKKQLWAMPMAELEPLVKNCGSESCYDSAFDFVVYQALDILAPFTGTGPVIPFGRVGKLSLSAEVESLRSEMVNKLIAHYEASGSTKPLALAYIAKSKLMPRSERYGYLMAKYRDMGLSEASSALLVESGIYLDRSNREQLKDFYLTVVKAVKTPGIEQLLEQMEAKSADVNFASQVLPGEKIKAEVNWNNMRSLWLHLYRVPGNLGEESVKTSVVASWKPVASKEITSQDSVLLMLSSASEFPGQGAGRYAILASERADCFQITGSDKVQVRSFTVSGLCALESEDVDGSKGRIYITDGRNGSPVAGASVVMTPRQKGKKVLRFTTGSDGSIEQPEGGYEILASAGGDTLRFSSWRGAGRNQPGRSTRVKILTDLALYHPGDTVQFMALAWSQLKESAGVEKDLNLEVVMLDANYNPVDTIKLTTDIHGRAYGQMKLPEDGLLGNYTLLARTGDKNFGQSSITVAEYKAPGFFVEVTDAGEGVEIGDTITLRGRALTYSGLPVAGAQVSFSIRARMPWWLFPDSDEASYGASSTSDGEGNFCLNLPTAGLRGTPYARCAYELEVAVTSPDGETQLAPKTFFSLGNARQIMASIPPVKERVKDAEFTVLVTDLLDHSIGADVSYDLTRDGKSVAEGSFRTPTLRISLADLPSGRYEWKFSTEGAKDLTLPMILYSKGESVPPCDTALWLPERTIVCSPGQKEVSFQVGSSYPDSWLLMQTADASAVTQERWLKVNARNETITLPAPKPGSRAVIRFAACRNLVQDFQTVEIKSAEYAEKLNPEVISIRDRTVPGDQEKWSFLFRLGDKPAPFLAAAATMSDKALDAIVPFQWSLARSAGWAIPGSLSSMVYNGHQTSWFRFGRPRSINVEAPCVPEWNFYGQSLMGSVRVGGMVYNMRSSRALSADGMMLKESNVMMAAAKTEAAVEEEADDAVAGAMNSGASTEEVKMRPAEMPLAFFKPDLKADADGRLNIDFEVPDFNTTWKLQLAAWTDAMKTSVTSYEMVASKKVIANLNAPRFVRTGDEIIWRATLSNASDSVAEVGGSLEITDALSGVVLESREFEALALGASESRIVEMLWKVPYSHQMIAVKVIARSGRNADGEQTLVGVLPSSSPVIDSKPFYIGRKDLSFSTQLPDNLTDGKSTLEFCGNPLWYCITALPDIQEPDGNSIISLTNNLFANALAAHLATKYPQIGEAIASWQSDKGVNSPLISNLEKNQELKSVALGNTPWVNDAASETMRMERLSSLLDAGRSDKIIRKSLSELGRRQSADGGWSWCEGMNPSEFITMRILAAFGLMKAQGCLPAEAEKMAVKAIRYIDREIEKTYSSHPDWITETTLLRYLYVRGYFDAPVVGAFASLHGRAISLLASNWKNLDITDKSLAAIVLKQAGKSGKASEILESLRQFAVKSDVQGVWFDNPRSGSRLLTTTLVLQAFSQLAPGDELVDGMRQWLELQRRTQSWRNEGDAAFIVATLLQSGSDWTSAPAPVVSIGGQQLPLSEFERFTQSGFFTLDATYDGKELRIERQEGVPAWGGVMTQSVRPISDVQAAEVPDLSISKTIYAVDETANGTELSQRPLQVGDKVRVALTLTAARRIDYVAVTDERAACLEPVDQVSGYEWRDGTGYYREVRNASTQLFISTLEKGVSMLWYDCFVGQEGEFSCGIATAQSLQSPMITAHSGGRVLKISSR